MVPLELRLLIKGISTFFPSITVNSYRIIRNNNVLEADKGRGTDVARYCYSVWLRHLVMAYENGMKTFPNSVAELGPGRSLGLGLAALISGSNRYYAFDVIEQVNSKRNIAILEDLIELFHNKSDIPGEDEFPQIKPLLKSYNFPSHILTRSHINNSLRPERLNLLRNLVRRKNYGHNSIFQIKYSAPWYDSEIVEENSIDMVLSQAVMEHVTNISEAYERLYQWIKPGGFMSHKIDYRSHGNSELWNGHWTYSDLLWKLIHGRRTFTINREPHSKHIELTEKMGFNLICNIQDKDYSGIQRHQLSDKFAFLSDSDLNTSGSFIQAAKPLS